MPDTAPAVHIVSGEPNCFYAALLLASRGFEVALEGSPARTVPATVFGRRHRVHLRAAGELSGSPRIGLVAAEGEDLAAGVSAVLGAGTVDLLVVVGGGAAGIVEAADVAHRHGIARSRVFVASAFVWGGRQGDPVVVDSEKHDILCGFLADPDPDAAALARRVVPTARVVDAVSVALAGLNGLVHPVPMLLGATEIERGTGARFFVDTFGDGVSAVAGRLDGERLALAARLGRTLPTFEQMLDSYYAAEGVHGTTLRERVNGLPAYQRAPIPGDFGHRYLTHELRANLAPMAAMADILGVEAPVTHALVVLGSILAGRDLGHGAAETGRRLLDLAGIPAPEPVRS